MRVPLFADLQCPDQCLSWVRRVRDFVQHAREFGFFLDIHRFLDQVYTRGSRSNSLTILLNVVYLLGAKLSANPQVQTQEQSLLSRALQYLPRALPEDRGGAMYVMQAEVLLANYFFNGNRQLEGMYHTNAAVSIAMTFNLHLIRSNRRCRSAAEASRSLPPPVDTLEEGERINGFWTVFVLDRCWAIASGSAPAFTDDEAAGTQIDTPWPMDLSAYQAVSILSRRWPVLNPTDGYDATSIRSPVISALPRQCSLSWQAPPQQRTAQVKAFLRLLREQQFCTRWPHVLHHVIIHVGISGS